jgi:hypothetical protein
MACAFKWVAVYFLVALFLHSAGVWTLSAESLGKSGEIVVCSFGIYLTCRYCRWFLSGFHRIVIEEQEEEDADNYHYV